jgi:hypothetical protein
MRENLDNEKIELAAYERGGHCQRYKDSNNLWRKAQRAFLDLRESLDKADNQADCHRGENRGR